ncbi:MAG: hypothetical protein ACXWZM_01450 [Solirubrobacterales bacterium]
MQSNTAKAGLGALLIAVAVIAFIALKGGDSGNEETTTSGATATTGGATATTDGGSAGGGSTAGGASKPSVPVIVVKNGKPVGGVKQLTYDQGDRIRFKVDSDVSDEVHVHGYDIAKDVEAGGSVSFDFTANLEGIFEAELESRQEQIGELTVNP